MPSRLRTRHLEVLLAVAEAGSMQRAARQIHLTQPAISKLICEIEDIFDTALFERSRRGVTLTECGETLAQHARALLNDLDRTQEEIAAIGRGRMGRLRIGALAVSESELLPQSLLALRKQAPALQIQVEEGTRASLLASLRRGELDCVIGRLNVGSSEAELKCEKLLRLPVLVVAAPRHPLARRRKVTLPALADYPWVLPRVGAPIRTIIDSLFVNAGIAAPVPLIESTSIRLNYELIRTSDMIGVMSEAAATAYAAQRKLSILPVTLDGHLPHVGVMMRPGRMSNAMTLFLKVLRETCAGHA
jgi:DNA-binding transcriptional LysR family regulator